MNAVTAGRLIGGLALVGIFIVWLGGRQLVLLTASEHQPPYYLWIHDADVAPGGTIAIRIRKDDTLDDRLNGVRVDFAHRSQYCSGDRSDTVDCEFEVPESAMPGTEYELGTEGFYRRVYVHTPTIALLRRIGRAAAAFAIALAFAGFLVKSTRFVFRRQWPSSSGWYFLAFPHIVLGYVAFSSLLAAAIGTHSIGFHVGALAVWTTLLAIPGRVRVSRGLPCYVVAPELISGERPDAPYRGSQIPERIVPVQDLEAAWSAAGLVVRRRRAELVLTLKGVGYAVIPVPGSESFGGEPFDVFTAKQEVASAITKGAATVLGPLRANAPGAEEIRA